MIQQIVPLEFVQETFRRQFHRQPPRPLLVPPFEPEDFESFLDGRRVVMEPNGFGAREFRADSAIIWPFEHCPQLKVVAVAGSEGDAVH